MLRFLQKDVYCVRYEDLDKVEIRHYFLRGNSNEIVCVVDQSGKYKGKIGYYSLESCSDIYEAVEEEYVSLEDSNFWIRARSYFAHYKFHSGREHVLLPVLDKTGKLVYLAYEDAEADREMRMLRELGEVSDALQFPDIYPDHKHVSIYGFNELAYFFACYLQKCDIPVKVHGGMWDLFPLSNSQDADSLSLNIYAEGMDGWKTNWTENLLKSVSVEFECVDRIYEMNIRQGTIRNQKGDLAGLLQYIQQKEVVIYGTGQDEQDAYDFLTAKGINVCCFVAKGLGSPHRMFGKRILRGLEARSTYKDAVFIECVSQNSAWGSGKVDYYDYIGYHRNERFFLLKDYVDISERNLINALKGTKVALIGEVWMCKYLARYLRQNNIFVSGYINMSGQDAGQELQEISAENIDAETMCLIAVQQSFKFHINQLEKPVQAFLRENGIDNYTDYFSYMGAFINIAEISCDKYTKDWLKPKKVILGSIEDNSGNAFFSGLLDGHPSILFVHYFGLSDDLNDSLFWMCVRLSMENADNILPLFWELYKNGIEGDEGDQIISDAFAFNKKMEMLLSRDKQFTSQELFVMFHMAYMYMYGWDIQEKEIRDMVIYWVPQFITRDVLEECSKWLGSEEVPCDVINVVRNACTRNGSRVKMQIFYLQKKAKQTYTLALRWGSDHGQDLKYGERMVVRFEDLKCHSQKTLLEICDQWQIKWSDSLMHTTIHGKNDEYYNGKRMVSGFDLEPVYNHYEEYLSEFDRMRIMLTTGPWQRKWGYPYIELSRFTRRELQKMFLDRFRFEDMVEVDEFQFESDLRKQRNISEMLQTVRMLEFDW